MWGIRKTIGLADCYIATMAAENDAAIYTFNRYFREIKKHINIKVF